MLTGRIASFAVRQLPKTLSEVRSLQLILTCLVLQFYKHVSLGVIEKINKDLFVNIVINITYYIFHLHMHMLPYVEFKKAGCICY